MADNTADKIAMLCAITNCTPQQAAQLLANAGGDMNLAVNNFWEGGGGDSSGDGAQDKLSSCQPGSSSDHHAGSSSSGSGSGVGGGSSGSIVEGGSGGKRVMSSERAAIMDLRQEVEQLLLDMKFDGGMIAAVLPDICEGDSKDHAVMRCISLLQEELSRREAARLSEEDASATAADEALARRVHQDEEQRRREAQIAREAAEQASEAMARDLTAQYEANEHTRARMRPRADNMEVLRERINTLYLDRHRKELALTNLMDEEQVIVQQVCNQINSSGGEFTLVCKLQEHGERLLVKKRLRSRSTATPQSTRSTATPPPPPPPPPGVDYNNHSRYNEHGVRVMQPVRLLVHDAAPPVVSPPPVASPPPAVSSSGAEAAPPALPPATGLDSHAPALYQDVPMETRALMHALPFRVKYEVEVLIGMKKLLRWALCPQPLLEALAACVRQEGEARCLAALHTMATQNVGWFMGAADFERARVHVASAAMILPALGGAGGRTHAEEGLDGNNTHGGASASISAQRSVEVLSCHYCCPSGRVIVRPAELQSSNRVLRLVGDFCGTDALLRVSFVNDGTLMPVNRGFSIPERSQQTIAKFWREFRARRRAARGGSSRGGSSRAERVLPPESESGPSKWDVVATALREGICVGGELFRWLAPSSSQMKSMGMWFVRETNGIDAPFLRRHLGDFSHIKTAALYLARLGQTLSATTVAVALQSAELMEREQVDDVVSPSGEKYSDGCCFASYKLLQLLHDAMVSQQRGEIPSLARLLASEPSGSLPYSAVQVRLGGIKGVLSLKMGIEGRRLFWRESMKKFDAEIVDVEICEWAAWHPGYLNRYIIMLLEDRGVPYEVLQALQAKHIAQLSRCLHDRWAARQLLHSIGALTEQDGESESVLLAGDSAYGGVLGAALGTLKCGVGPEEDPFLRSILHSICASLKRGVIERARILLDEAATLMGVMEEDEEGVLEYGEVFLQVRPPWADEEAGAQIIEGMVIVYRSPGMHPGGVRLLRAVNRPELAHHLNEIVFPRKGPRPHPAEMSQGDLDGDKYLVIWDASIVDAVSPMEPEPRPEAAPLHKQPTSASAGGGSAAAAAWVRRMPRPPAPVPSEDVLAKRVAQVQLHEQLQQQHRPHAPTIADHLAHAPPRRRAMTTAEMQSEGELLRDVHEAGREAEIRRFESELLRAKSSEQRRWDAATLQHERQQEEEAVRFYLYYGKRQNLGQISNLWLAYADKFGPMHEETRALCRLAGEAVQFQKSGMPVQLDRRRFNLAVRPDYMMRDKQGASYKSKKALGRLYREAIAPSEPAAPYAAAQGGALGCQMPPDGYERFHEQALRSRDAYEDEVRWLLTTYGVQTEGELLSGRVAKFDNDLIKHSNQRDNEETLRRAVHELWTTTRRHFEESVEEAVTASGGSTLRAQISRQLAYAWYVAGYRLHEGGSPGVGDSALPSAEPASQRDAASLRSFPWVAWQELMDVRRCSPTRQSTVETRVSCGPDLVLDDPSDLVEGYSMS